MRIVGILLLFCVFTPLSGQAPSARQLTPEQIKTWKAAMALLQYAIDARVFPVTDFHVSGEHYWRVNSMQLANDTAIVAYSPSADLVFHVQSIHCQGMPDLKLPERNDATILGPTETAAQFYEGNIKFAVYRADSYLPCTLPYMGFTEQDGVVKHETDVAPREAKIVTCHGRAIRHLVNWLQFLVRQNDNPRRAADFFVTILDKEKENLLQVESEGQNDETAQQLDLFETLFPAATFNIDVPLNEAEKSHVRDFLATRIRIRRKLSVFLPEAEQQRIKRDEILLRAFH